MKEAEKLDILSTMIAEKCQELEMGVTLLVLADNAPPALIVKGTGDDEFVGHAEVGASLYALLMVPGQMERIVRWFREYCDKKTA